MWQPYIGHFNFAIKESWLQETTLAVGSHFEIAIARDTDFAQLPGRYIDLPKNDISPSQIRDAGFLRLAREVDDETCSSRSDHLLSNWRKHLDSRSTIAN